MLRIVNQHYKNLHTQLASGGFGNKFEDMTRVTQGGGFFGVSSKMIRNMYVLSANLIDRGEVKLNWAFDESTFRHFLTMLGVSEDHAAKYKYIGDGNHTIATYANIQFGKAVGSVVEVTVKVTNNVIDNDKNIVSTSTPIVGVQLLDTRRRRFDLMLDNPLHVAFGMIEARKKAEKVTISFNSPGYPSRMRESEALHLAGMELFNAVAFHNTPNSSTGRNILGKGYGVEAQYAVHRVIMDALGGSVPSVTTFVYDFTDVEEFTCSSLLRKELYYDYSLFPMGRLRPTNYYGEKNGQRYELSNRLSIKLFKALREKAAERLKEPTAPQLFDDNRVVLVESLHDVLKLEKDFYIQDTAISKKTVVGSLREYYAAVGGVTMALVRSETSKIVDKKQVRSFSLVDLRNGAEVIRCEATVSTFEKVDGVYEVEPITMLESVAFNSIDVKIFSDYIHALLKNGHTIVIRKRDGGRFTLYPMLFGQLPYVGDRDESIDDRIRAQMNACFTDVTEVELKPKQGWDVRGYKFIAEPQR